MAGAPGTYLWPVEGDQKIAAPYHSATGILEIDAPQGASVRAIAAGWVTAVGDDWLQMTAGSTLIRYMGLQNLQVGAGQVVAGGTRLAESGAGGRLKLAIYQPLDPTELFQKPTPPPAIVQPIKPVAPAPPPPAAPLRLTATRDGVRIRETPVDGRPVGTLKLEEIVESLEPADATRAKLGIDGEWLHIRRDDGTDAFAAAWFLTLAPPEPPVIPAPAVGGLLGMNLDIDHPRGHPEAADLQGIGWVRLKFNVSFNPADGSHGNRDIEAAYQRYLPHLERYAQAGLKVLMVFTHQLYGEGAGFDWTQMDSGRWQQLTTPYADFARQVASRFSGTNRVHAYQVWNEQDTKPEHARAAVPIPPADYAHLLAETIRAIRQVDSATPIITGGHTTGPGPGSHYAGATLAAMPPDVRPDGIAFHPYGRGRAGQRFSIFGPLSEEIEAYSAVLPDKPVWITEWGVLDQQGRADLIDDVLDYASGFVGIVRQAYAGKVAAAIWYAWADGMDNGFGLVDSGGQPKPRLFERWRTLG